jgi:MtrB/PioB family decaheme-associated outer membrane protein
MKRKLVCLLIANLGAALPALGEETPDFRLSGTIGIGAMHNDDNGAKDPAKLNEYQDLSSGLITNFDVKGRGSRYWLDFFGENLGRDDQYVNLRGGVYDSFKYRLYTDQLRHNFLIQGSTPYAGFGSPAHTATFPQLNGSTWHGVDLGYRRRDDGLMFELQSATPWYVRVDANQVTWKGSKPGAASQGTSPGNGFVDLGLPVEYKTRNATAEGGYNTTTMHFDLSFMASKFENDNESVTWTNGYFGNGIDRTYLPADNRYQRLMGNATFRQLPWNTTVAARFTDDELKSSVAVGTSVLNGTAGQIGATGASAPTFDGKVKNQTFTISAASVPMKALDTKVYFNYGKREDQSTQIVFDSTAIPGPFENEPFSYRKSNYGFDAYYRLDRANRLGGGYDYLDGKREGRFDYDRTKDSRIFLEWKNTSLDNLGARFKYTRLNRDSNFLLGSSGTGTTDPNYENRYVTAFDLSNVTQDQFKLTLDFTPMERLDLGFEGIVKNNDYRDNVLGRLSDDRQEVYLNASYGTPGGTRFTVFGDYESIKYDSRHRIVGSGSTNGAYEPSSPANASNYNWSGNIKDRNWAAGFAFDWPATEKLAIKASAIYYRTDGSVDLALQEGVPASVTRPGPIANWDDSKRTSITVKGVYAFSKALSFTAGYAFEKYEYSDSQFDGYRYTVPSSSRQDSYLDGVYANPQYKANILYATVSWRFQ